jgi:hypothetical protein
MSFTRRWTWPARRLRPPRANNVQMQIEIRNDLEAALTASGQPEGATEHFRRALKLALESEDPFEQGRARDGLAALDEP